jgi:hypothetical protein
VDAGPTALTAQNNGHPHHKEPELRLPTWSTDPVSFAGHCTCRRLRSCQRRPRSVLIHHIKAIEGRILPRHIRPERREPWRLLPLPFKLLTSIAAPLPRAVSREQIHNSKTQTKEYARHPSLEEASNPTRLNHSSLRFRVTRSCHLGFYDLSGRPVGNSPPGRAFHRY